MAKKRKEPRKLAPPPSASDQARDELFSHILRCGVLEATPEHQKEWFDDTMLYLADRYEDLTEDDLTRLRTLGERYLAYWGHQFGKFRQRIPADTRTPPPTPTSTNHPRGRPGACSTPVSAVRYTAPR